MILRKLSLKTKLSGMIFIYSEHLRKPFKRLYLLGMLLLIGAVITALPGVSQSSAFNVRAFGATGNGITDDAPAIQKAEVAAEKAGGGAVYIPAGKYLINSTIMLGSNIEIYGDGDSTDLMRTNVISRVPTYGEDCDAQNPPLDSMRHAFRNRHYNCEDHNIHLHDMEIDGSAITQVPNSVLVAFSGLVDSTVDHVTIKNAPQDGMFFRNGGHNLNVENNKILLHDTLWGNGSGINIEMHVNGHIWGPVNISNNEIVTGGPNFCTAALSQNCRSDSDCSGLVPATCGHGAAVSVAIGVFWVDGTHPPEVNIANNHIWVGNNHYAINCNGCKDSTISGNVIRSMRQRNVPGLGTYTGISSYSPAAKEVQNLTIKDNTIEGTGESADGRAILVSGQGDAAGIVIQNNMIAHKNPPNGSSVVEVQGLRDVNISGNRLCFVPNNDIRVGNPMRPVLNGRQTNNTIVHIGKQSGSTAKECLTVAP